MESEVEAQPSVTVLLTVTNLLILLPNALVRGNLRIVQCDHLHVATCTSVAV